MSINRDMRMRNHPLTPSCGGFIGSLSTFKPGYLNFLNVSHYYLKQIFAVLGRIYLVFCLRALFIFYSALFLIHDDCNSMTDIILKHLFI